MPLGRQFAPDPVTIGNLRSRPVRDRIRHIALDSVPLTAGLDLPHYRAGAFTPVNRVDLDDFHSLKTFPGMI